MALIKCPECGKDISNTSEKCIHCGFPIEKPKKKDWIKAHRKIVILSKFQDVALIPIEKDDKTRKPRGEVKLEYVCKLQKLE